MGRRAAIAAAMILVITGCKKGRDPQDIGEAIGVGPELLAELEGERVRMEGELDERDGLEYDVRREATPGAPVGDASRGEHCTTYELQFNDRLLVDICDREAGTRPPWTGTIVGWEDHVNRYGAQNRYWDWRRGHKHVTDRFETWARIDEDPSCCWILLVDP